MFLNYNKWKKLHESSQPDATYVTITYPENNFNKLKDSEVYRSTLNNLISKLDIATISNYQYDGNNFNFDLSLASDETSDILDVLGMKTKFKVSVDSVDLYLNLFRTFISTAAKKFPNVKQIFDESTDTELKYVIAFGPGEVDTNKLINFIFSDERIADNYPRIDKEYLLTTSYLESVLDNSELSSQLNKRTNNSFKVQLISEIRNLINVEVDQIDLTIYKNQNENILNELTVKSKKFDSFDESEKVNFILTLLKLQKKLSDSCKAGRAERKIASEQLIRSYIIFDSINLSDEEIDRIIYNSKKEL